MPPFTRQLFRTPSRPLRSALRAASCVLAFTALLAAPPDTRAAVVDDFVAGWTFDETSGTFADASGNGNTLNAEGTPYGTGFNGIADNALTMNGGDYAVRPKTGGGSSANDSFGQFAIGDTFSASFWLKQNLLNSSFRRFVGREDGSEPGGWAVRSGTGATREELRWPFRDPADALFSVGARLDDEGGQVDGR